VRTLALFISFNIYLVPLSASAQYQDPAAQQDEEAARQKVLKAADQIDMIEANSEEMKSSVDTIQATIAKLQDENMALKQQLADLQAAFNKSEADRAKERQALLDAVAELVKSKALGSKKKTATAASNATAATSIPPKTADSDAPLAPPPDATSATAGDASTSGDEASPKPRKGYYHIVQPGETLTMICSAYRQNGIKITVSQICKANGLTDKSVLQVGQKLFIPQPGT